MGPILLEHMTIGIVCNDLQDFWTESGAVISKNVFLESIYCHYRKWLIDIIHNVYSSETKYYS